MMNDQTGICFLNDTKIFFDKYIHIKCKELNKDNTFYRELENFIINIRIPRLEGSLFLKIGEIISPCLSAFFIIESYSKLNTNRITDFYANKDKSNYERIIEKNDYIELRPIESSAIRLIYHIEDEKLCAIKKKFFLSSDSEDEKLRSREIYNYRSKIIHPFLPKFYGITQENQYLVFEYINGKTLSETDISKYSEIEVFSIIIQILSVFDYLHANHFIYRDLKPDNVMIDSNKTAILIDFDRMLNENQMNNDNEENDHTIDFSSAYAAPEINSGKFTNKCDIYSIGKIINYIMNVYNSSYSIEYPQIKQLIDICCEDEPNKRPNVSEIISSFHSIFLDKNIILSNVDRNSQFELGNFFLKKNKINEAIKCFNLAANQNMPKAQFYLGFIYYEGKYTSRNIDKAIHYFSLAANQNYLEAQYNLGVIYSDDKYIPLDIDKAIYYFSLAANQNNPESQCKLGTIYYVGKYISQDINKAIHYYSLAAKQNYPLSQFFLGFIYYDGKYIARDINKAIHYFWLAANQNYPQAQFFLGKIYDDGIYISRDINKAIHYYSLAANQNFSLAQYCLGFIYDENKYASQDNNKTIHYFTLAANNNIPDAQYLLGLIYYEGNYTTQDINKAIYYFSLAANQNFPEAQYVLGVIYYKNEYVTRNINKAIHYFSLAANQNFPQAQYVLGVIYYENEYIARDIDKSIYYFSLSAIKNYLQAQVNLGFIYYDGKYIKRNINKSIYYFSLAANQNNPEAQFNLGNIYYEGKYIARDINKSIYYFSLATNQNFLKAQFNLGLIYYEGKYITRDIHKSIYYFSLAANKNNPEAQFNLGFIYYKGKYITRDINKSIYYFSLAANQNLPEAQFSLGFIYYDGKYISQDINKAIHHFSIASNQNYPKAQFFLGLIYDEGKYISQDINKAIHYYSLAANQNIPQAQFNLGFIYYNILNKTNKNINLGIFWILESSERGCTDACFFIGFLYHEGKHIKKNIKESIRYYKEASSFNNQYAKNNLGIIYKHGIDNEIEKNTSNAEIFFSESIKQKNDNVSMYNLAHLYIYEDHAKESIDKSINLLIDSLNLKFYQSVMLLLIVLFKKYDRNIENIKNDLSRLDEKVYDYLIHKIEIYRIMSFLNDETTLEEFYSMYRNIDFLYDQSLNVIETMHLYDFKNNQNLQIIKQGKDITQDFFEGFDCDI